MYQSYAGIGPLNNSNDSSIKQKAIKIFNSLPLLSHNTLINPSYLVELGIWESEPKGIDYLYEKTLQYPTGRQILVKAVVNSDPSSPSFMTIDENNDDEVSNYPEYVTYRAFVVEKNDSKFLVEIDRADGDKQRKIVEEKDIYFLNNSHIFPISNDELKLEDGLRCKYSSPLMKAKMCEIAFSLSKIISKIDFQSEDLLEIERLQCKCVSVIRSHLNLITFQNYISENEQGRDRSRYCKDDISRFAIYGQGHCHTVSSIMTAFLSPWEKFLGIEVKYRRGITLRGIQSNCEYNNQAGTISNDVETHQWLEFTTRPTMRTFVCDLFRDDGVRVYQEKTGKKIYDNWIHFPAEVAYQTYLYPNGKIEKFSGYSVEVNGV
eukprot:c21722_g2_i2.p1 GENE.c21722_g2_i2~~c21722_g2_i2.p1  ORF type:complete len:377 (-),score=100.92 c21722_g2_i2:125-1255(-)